MPPTDTRSDATLIKLFLAALAVRWCYDAVLYLAMGDRGLMGVDSFDYLHRAQVFVSQLQGVYRENWDWFGGDPMQMPVFTWTTALSVLAFPSYGTLAFVLSQGALDAATCVLVHRIAHAFDPRIALAAAVTAVVNPTQIVIAGLLYPDTAFTFFVALLILGSVRWIKTPSWFALWCIAGGFVGAAYARVLIAPFGAALITFLLIAGLVARDMRRRRSIQLATAAAVFTLTIFTVSLRNHIEYGSWALTPQSGMHLSRWIVPLVREAKDGTPWRKTYDELEQRAHDRFGTLADNPFELSRQYMQIAMEERPRLGLLPIVNAWTYGATINLATPAIVLSPPVIQLPRTGFYDTVGATMATKIFNFLFHSDNSLYAWILLTGICGTAAIRIIQLVGALALLRSGLNLAGLLLIAGWIAFILLVNGPVASPKYRLPMEPALAVLTGAGWVRLREYWRKPGRP